MPGSTDCRSSPVHRSTRRQTLEVASAPQAVMGVPHSSGMETSRSSDGNLRRIRLPTPKWRFSAARAIILVIRMSDDASTRRQKRTSLPRSSRTPCRVVLLRQQIRLREQQFLAVHHHRITGQRRGDIDGHCLEPAGMLKEREITIEQRSIGGQPLAHQCLAALQSRGTFRAGDPARAGKQLPAAMRPDAGSTSDPTSSPIM